ncbi:hypothetical protein B0T26DRAFT_748469 [Lasiosphaeria miniovina]|uniref:Uncharacterized protein n=1 Tax=Lasiosphaeria miniovina TaxID=1954250 RepID=A0AA40B5S3_9PEZI|nr:uncharacterized protein B0T26DRAFT_748469 [Lasiosphaeria miniovina]KAK0728219.1 hypothetical protein B0T26DRAFT_748469 [Lasiosphaeria miniovina]
MAPTWSHLVLRDDTTTNSNALSTGAIAGIAAGAGTLLLSAAGLFIIYWRRQRAFDRMDAYYANGPAISREDMNFATSGVPVVYTMDYKLDQDEGASVSAHTPDATTSPIDMTAAAMPTHPAYIPRALVRGASSSRPSIASYDHQFSPPLPKAPSVHSVTLPTVGSSNKEMLDDELVQAYLNQASSLKQASSKAPSTVASPDFNKEKQQYPSRHMEPEHEDEEDQQRLQEQLLRLQQKQLQQRGRYLTQPPKLTFSQQRGAPVASPPLSGNSEQTRGGYMASPPLSGNSEQTRGYMASPPLSANSETTAGGYVASPPFSGYMTSPPLSANSEQTGGYILSPPLSGNSLQTRLSPTHSLPALIMPIISSRRKPSVSTTRGERSQSKTRGAGAGSVAGSVVGSVAGSVRVRGQHRGGEGSMSISRPQATAPKQYREQQQIYDEYSGSEAPSQVISTVTAATNKSSRSRAGSTTTSAHRDKRRQERAERHERRRQERKKQQYEEVEVGQEEDIWG